MNFNRISVKMKVGGPYTVLLWMASLLFLSVSCSKPDEEILPPEGAARLGRGFYVLNEGNFTSGNASMSYYQADSLKMIHNLFYQRNKVPLGDVAQSMTFWKKYAFVVVNNSGIIWLINASNATVAGKITGLYSPRMVCVIDDHKAYVSDFQQKGLTVFDPSSLQTLGSISTGKTSEKLLLHKGKVFAANWSQYNQTTLNNTVQVINAAFDQVVDSLVLTREPNSMVIDKNEKLWVLCSGGFLNEDYPALYRIDANSLEVERKFDFPDLSGDPQHLTINRTGDTLFYLNQGIYRMPVGAEALPAAPHVLQGNRNFYSLAVDPGSSTLLATDAGNYLQKGYVFRFNPDGTIIDSLAAGIIPAFIGFNENP